MLFSVDCLGLAKIRELFFMPFFAGSVKAARDAGWYGCAAVSSSGSDLARAEVRVARESDAPPPIIQVGPVNQTLPAKSSATLPCDATDYDALVWLKDGVPLRGTTNRPTQRVSVDSDNTLSIKGTVQVWPLTQFLPVSFL